MLHLVITYRNGAWLESLRPSTLELQFLRLDPFQRHHKVRCARVGAVIAAYQAA